MKKESILRSLQKYMGTRKPLLPLALTLSAVSAVLGMIPYILIWKILQDLLSHSGIIDRTNAVIYAWWATGIAIVSVIFYFFALMTSHLAAFRVEGNLRRTAMEKLVHMPLGFFDSNTTGKIRKIIDDDSSTTHTFLAHQLPDLAGTVIMPVGTLAVIFLFDWKLAIACMIPLVFVLITLRMMMGKKSRVFQKMYMDALEQMSSEAVEYVRGIPVVKVFQQTIYSFKRFHESILKYNRLVKKYTDSWESSFSFYTVIIHSFAFVLIPAAIILMSHRGEYIATLVDMFLYVMITPILSVYIMRSMHLSQSMFIAREALERIEGLVDVEPMKYVETEQQPDSCEIQFNDVLFTYPGSSTQAVNHVSFTIPEGSTCALVGPSGGGKTTIARLIPRFWDVLEGSITIGGIDVRAISKEQLMNSISFVFQTTKLFKTSILENITYGIKDASLVNVNEAIDLAQCRNIIDRLEDGIYTKVGSDGTYLSGGEMQRIALARAILKDSPIIVLDEATAFADPENEHLIHKALFELRRNKTVLMIAHRLSSVEDADQILVIDNGTVIERGTHSDLLRHGQMYHRMWNEYQTAIEWTIQSEEKNA
ncbi:MAG: ABC transporter ATP-binding protein [Sphaerochaetaceae bacterium]|nr:ABC transporter ATP-binding protein [Sphaerochaetaceae bacterium]